MKLSLRFVLLALAGGLHLIAQAQQGPPRGAVSEAGPMPGFSIVGRVADSATHEPIPFSTVSLLRVSDSTQITGSLVGDDGRFTIDRLQPGPYLLKVNFLGYRSAWRQAIISPEQPTARLGTIDLASTTARLQGVVIEGERPVFQLGIDRKTFDVSRSNLNPGGTATDVLANVPTVTVDVDGNVSMRNNENVTIYIDGRPSGITASNRAAVLKQIPASAIDRIELITSPSARYDAEGTAGIINIILKKNKLEGLNGSVQASVGTRMKYAGSGNIAYRNKFINAYLNYNYRYNRRFGNGSGDRYTNILDSATQAYIPSIRTASSNQGNSYDRGQYIKGGIDFSLPKDNLIGVSAGLNASNNWNYDLNRYLYFNPGAETAYDTAQRYSRTYGTGRNYEATLSHVKKFDAKGHEWSSQANFSDFTQDNSTIIEQLGALSVRPGQEFLGSAYQLNPLFGRTQVLTVQTDYVRPLSETKKYEFGAKSSTRDLFNQQKYFVGTNEVNVTPINIQTSQFAYNEQILAGYGIWQQQLGKFGYQAGLRFEETFINTRFQPQDSVARFNSRDYAKFVPTINLNYKLSPRHEFQLSYAKRLNRPGPGSLNPFTDFSDPNTLRIGNPSLNPEVIHAFEGNWQLNTAAVSLTSTGFYRYTKDMITRAITVGSDGRAIVQEVNAGQRQDVGAEFVGRWQIIKGYSLTGNTSLFYSNIDAPNVANGIVRSNYNYSFRILGSAQIRPGTNLQTTAFYRSPFIIPQGKSRPMYSVDFAISQEFWARKATVSLAINDVFNTMRFGMTSSDKTFNQAMLRKRETQVATLTLAYRFGSLDNLSRRRDNRAPGNGGQGGGGDFGF